MVKIKLKKYIINFSAASFAYILLTEIGQTLSIQILFILTLDYLSIYNALPDLKLYTC